MKANDIHGAHIGIRVSVDSVQRGVTVVCLVCNIPGVGYISVICAGYIAADRDVCRYSKGRRCGISDCDDLYVGRSVTAVVCKGPCPGDDLFSLAQARCYCISERRIE